MSESRTTSTLELVVNEQQFRNMSQIDLSNGQNEPIANGQQANDPNNPQSNSFWSTLCQWPHRCRLAMNSKMDQIREKSDSNMDFALKLSQEMATIFAWSFCFLSTVIAPLIFIFAGLMNLSQCIASPALPYVVFSTGFVMTVSNLFNLGLACDLPILRNQDILSDDLKSIIASIVNVLMNVIAGFLFIICAHLVYTLDPNYLENNSNNNLSSAIITTATATQLANNTDTSSTSETSANDNLAQFACNPFLYNFTYWYISLTLIIISTLCLLALCLYAYNRYKLALIRGSTVTSSNTNTNHR